MSDSTEESISSESDIEINQRHDESQDDDSASNDDEENQVEEGSSAKSDEDENETSEIAEPPTSPNPKKTVTAKKKAVANEPIASTSKPSTSKSAVASKRKSPAKGTKMDQHDGNSKSITTKDMIIEAVTELNDKKGSTSQGIKKYMTENHKVTDQRMKMVTKLLRTADREGWLLQVSGTGASAGSHFKLPPESKKLVNKQKKKDVEMNDKEEKSKSKAKAVTKRKINKPTDEKEVPAKKKKAAAEDLKKKAATAAPKMKAAAEAPKKKATAVYKKMASKAIKA